MHLVNIKALERAREVVDGAVTERALTEQFNTFDCRERLAHDLGYSLLTLRNGRFWCATAIARNVLAETVDLLRTKGVDPAKEHVLLHSRSLQALSLVDAETAILCALLDPDLELVAAEQETAQLYSEPPPQSTVEVVTPVMESMLQLLNSLRLQCHAKIDESADQDLVGLLIGIEMARTITHGNSDAARDLESRPLVEDEFPHLARYDEGGGSELEEPMR